MYTFTQDSSALVFSTVLAMLGTYAFMVIGLYVVQVIAYWKLFTKAGEAGWKSIIPIYNTYILFKIAWKTKFFWIMLAVGIVGGFIGGILAALLSDTAAVVAAVAMIVYWIIAIFALVIEILLCVKLAQAYGKGGGFAVGLIFLNIIFILILAFGSAQYRGPQQK